VRRKSDTTRNESHHAKQEKVVRLHEGEGSVREKYCLRVKILNFNSRDILRRLYLTKFYSFFLKIHSCATGGYYVGWKVSIDVIWATYYVNWDILTDVISSTPLQSFKI